MKQVRTRPDDPIQVAPAEVLFPRRSPPLPHTLGFGGTSTYLWEAHRSTHTGVGPQSHDPKHTQLLHLRLR